VYEAELDRKENEKIKKALNNKADELR